MRRNCGVVAYDKLVGELNGRSNLISMDTLAKLAQDNGFLLFPMKVPVDAIENVKFPAIVYTDHHFEVWDKIQADPTVLQRPFVYMLSHNPTYEYVMTELDAKRVRGGNMGKMFTPPKSKSPWEAMTKGSTGGWAKGAEPWGPAFTTAAGAILPFTPAAPLTPLITSGMGAAGMAGGGGFQGTDKGWGNVGSTMLGAAGGYGLGSLGAGIGKGIQGVMHGGMHAKPSAWSQFTGGFEKGMKGFFDKPILGFGPSGSDIWKGATSLFGGGGKAAGAGGVQGGISEAGAVGEGGGGFWDGLFGGRGSIGRMAAMGAAGGMLGNMMTDMPEYERPPELDEYRELMRQNQTPAGQLSKEEIERVLSTPYGQLTPDVASGYVESAMGRYANWAERERENITRKYNAYGRLNSSEHLEELSQVDVRLQEIRERLEAQVVQEQMQMEMQYRIQVLAQALGVETQAAAELAGFTQLAVEEAAVKYGLEVAEVQNIRDMFGDVGMMMGGA